MRPGLRPFYACHPGAEGDRVHVILDSLTCHLMTDEMKSIDRAMYVFMKQEQIAKNMLLDGEPVERVARLTEVPLYMVRKLKEEMELAEV